MKSFLKNYRQSPRKVRLVADAVRGKSVAIALRDLVFITKRATDPLAKLIKSAVANAKNNSNVSEENLFIKGEQGNRNEAHHASCSWNSCSYQQANKPRLYHFRREGSEGS